ncbi:MAG: cytochrome c [Pirellulales bacterium]
MNTPTRLCCPAAAFVALTILTCTLATHGQGTSKKRAVPPKFDPREVEQIFFPDARKALVGKRPGSMLATGSRQPSGSDTIPTPRGAGTLPPPMDGIRWSTLISAETLADEVKAYRPLLAAAVKTPSQFQGEGAREARRYFSTLATMFAIAAEYDAEVRWENQAAAARELFARAGFNSKSDNENVYNEARLRTADLAALLGGETLASPSNIEPKPNFNEQVANRPPLMWRLERAQRDRLAVWTANRADFNRNLGGIKHEAEMVAALAQVIQHPSYIDAEDESYLKYARALQKAALEIREAAHEKNADAARAAAGNLSKACNACHVDFRGE